MTSSIFITAIYAVRDEAYPIAPVHTPYAASVSRVAGYEENPSYAPCA